MASWFGSTDYQAANPALLAAAAGGGLAGIGTSIGTMAKDLEDSRLKEEELAQKKALFDMQKETHQLQVDTANQVKQDRAANTAFYNALNAPQTMQQATMTNLATTKPELFNSMELDQKEQDATRIIGGLDNKGIMSDDIRAKLTAYGVNPDSIFNKLTQQAKVSQVSQVLPSREDMLGSTSEQYAKAAGTVLGAGLPMTDTIQKMLMEQKAADRHVLSEAEKSNTAKSAKLDDELNKLYLDSAKNMANTGTVLGTDASGNPISVGGKGNPIAKFNESTAKAAGDSYNKLITEIDKLETGTGKGAQPLSAELRAKALTQADKVYTDLLSRHVDPELAREIALSKVKPQGDGSSWLGMGSPQYKIGSADFTPEELKIINKSAGIQGEITDAKVAQILPPINTGLQTAYSTLLGKVGSQIAANKAEREGLSMTPEAKRVAIASGLLERELKGVESSNIVANTAPTVPKDFNVDKYTDKASTAKALEIAGYARDLNAPHQLAIALGSQALAESSGNHTQITDEETKSRGKFKSYGLYQLNGDHLKKFEDMYGIPVEKSTAQQQTEYVIKTIDSNPKWKDAISKMTNSADVSEFLTRNFEKPKDANGEAGKRRAIADKLEANIDGTEYGKKYTMTAEKPSTITPKVLTNLETVAAGNPYSLETINAKQELAKIDQEAKNAPKKLVSKPANKWTDEDIKVASVLPDIPKDRNNWDLVDILSGSIGKIPMVQDPAKTKALNILADRKSDSKVKASDKEEGLESANLEVIPLGKIAKEVGGTALTGAQYIGSKIPYVNSVIKAPGVKEVVPVAKKMTAKAKKAAIKAAEEAKLNKTNSLTDFLMGLD